MRICSLGSLVRSGTLAAFFLAAGITASAADKTARDLLPPSTVAYLEIPQPAKVLNLLLDHPLAKEIQQTPDYQKALAGREYQQLQGAVKLVESKLGMKWRQAIEPLSQGGLCVGFDLPTQGVAVLLQTADESLAQKARDTIVELARADAKTKGHADPVKTDELRGIAIYQIANAEFVAMGKWLLVT